MWETGYNNTDNTRHEVATWVATDSEGNAIVSGTIRSGFSNPVYAASLLMKFDGDGNLLWRVVYESNFDGSSTRKCLVDAQNNIYVLGLGNSGTGIVTKVKKFSPLGDAIWAYFDTAGIGAPINFKLTPDNCLVITARAIFGSINGYAKIDMDGNSIWSLPGVASLTVGDVAGDAFGNSYIIHGNNPGSTIKKLSQAGSVIWQQNQGMSAFHVEVGTDQSPVISGFPAVGSGGAGFMKYNENGNLLWSNPDADGPENLLLHGSMRLDNNNAAYLPASTLFQMAVCKVNSDGTSAWTATMPTGTAQAIAFGSDNSVYVGGGTTARLTQAPIDCTVNGGFVSTTSPLTNLCLGDGNADIIQLSVIGNLGVGRFGLVRQSDLFVVAQNSTGVFNMENFDQGSYFAGHISVNQLSQLAGVTNINQLNGCYDLSNQIAVSTQLLNGGILAANGNTTPCSGSLSFTITGFQGPNSRFVLLNNETTEVLSQNVNGNFNFDPLPVGQYKIVHIAYANGVNIGAIIPPSIPPCVDASALVSVSKVPCGLQLNIAPNPSNGVSWVTFASEIDTYATLEVFDMNGRLATKLFAGMTTGQSTRRLEFDGSALPNGVYIYKLTTSELVLQEKLLLAR